MSSIGEKIESLSKRLPEGTVLSAGAFAALGTRAAVDQALSRLTESGVIMRIERGRYVLPVQTRFGTRAPSPESVIEALAAESGETIVSNGAVAANALGLTTQVPVRSVFLTSGRTRRLTLGKQVVEIRHVEAWQLRAPHRPAGQAVRALAWLGPEQAARAAAQLRESLAEEERRLLVSACASFPQWLAKTVSEAFVVAATGQDANA
ncbi:MAG TPA: DUF6088 family protein [Longimicrobium sp.]|jgi:DNA-binding transcriptional ArsR family regulator|nr:DUF6088 family protein [Longimicrobium sp.]